MNFFFDVNMSWRIAKMLAAYEEGLHQVVHITQHEDFKHNNTLIGGNTTPDEEFLEKLPQSKLDWKIISGDKRIITTPHQRVTLYKSGLTFFCLDRSWGKAGTPEQAWKIVKLWDEIVRLARQPGQSIYEINIGRTPGIRLIKGSHRE
jgi:hypothetical protein